MRSLPPEDLLPKIGLPAEEPSVNVSSAQSFVASCVSRPLKKPATRPRKGGEKIACLAFHSLPPLIKQHFN